MQDATLADKDEEKNRISAQLRGETIAYAVQSGIYNLGANFFEPYLNYRTQKYYSSHSKAHPGFGNYAQNLAGEFAGDIVGTSSLILAEALFPRHLHRLTRTMRGWVDPVYTAMAERIFADEKNNPDYAEKVEKWKTFHERNLVRSMIMASFGIAGNVLAQKTVLQNTSPAKVILAGKLMSTSLTSMLGLGVRFVFPDQMKSVDKWMSKNIFAPMMEGKDMGSDPSATYVEKLAHERDSHSHQLTR